MNSLCIVGWVKGEYEVKYTTDGKPIGKFSLSVATGYGDKKEYSYFNVVTFGKSAGNHGKYIGDGSKVGVTGSLKQERWEKDGRKNSKVVITAMQIEYLDPPKKKEDEDTPW
jgi:single-strand DNA-binding protein